MGVYDCVLKSVLSNSPPGQVQIKEVAHTTRYTNSRSENYIPPRALCSLWLNSLNILNNGNVSSGSIYDI